MCSLQGGYLLWCGNKYFLFTSQTSWLRLSDTSLHLPSLAWHILHPHQVHSTEWLDQTSAQLHTPQILSTTLGASLTYHQMSQVSQTLHHCSCHSWHYQFWSFTSLNLCRSSLASPLLNTLKYVGWLKNPSQNLSIQLTLVIIDSTTNFDSTRIVSVLDYYSCSVVHPFMHSFMLLYIVHFTSLMFLTFILAFHSCS
jgi:hypothetical protein